MSDENRNTTSTDGDGCSWRTCAMCGRCTRDGDDDRPCDEAAELEAWALAYEARHAAKPDGGV